MNNFVLRNEDDRKNDSKSMQIQKNKTIFITLKNEIRKVGKS